MLKKTTQRCGMCGSRSWNTEADRLRSVLEGISKDGCPNTQAGARPSGCSCPSCRAYLALLPPRKRKVLAQGAQQ